MSILVTSVVHAKESGEDEFGKAVKAMEDKNYDVACPLFEKAYQIFVNGKQLDKQAGSLYALAVCEADAGRLISARGRYNAFSKLYETLSTPLKLKHKERMKIAEDQIGLLATQIPKPTLTAPQDQLLPGTRVFLDDKEIELVMIGQPLEMDPGEHRVRVEIPGEKAWESDQLIIEKGEWKPIEIKWPKPPPPLVVKESRLNSRQKTAIAVGGVGVAGFVVGGVTGGLAMSNKKIADANCDVQNCTAIGADAGNTGRTLANISTVGFGVGLAGIASGVVLWLTAPKVKDSGTTKGAIRFDVIGAGSDGTVVGFQGTF